MRKYVSGAELQIGDVVLKGNKTVHNIFIPVNLVIESVGTKRDEHTKVLIHSYRAQDNEDDSAGQWVQGFLHVLADGNVIEIERDETATVSP